MDSFYVFSILLEKDKVFQLVLGSRIISYVDQYESHLNREYLTPLYCLLKASDFLVAIRLDKKSGLSSLNSPKNNFLR